LTDCRYLRQGKKCISVINVAVPTCFIIFLLTRSGFDYDLNIGKNNNFDFVDKNKLLQKYVLCNNFCFSKCATISVLLTFSNHSCHN